MKNIFRILMAVAVLFTASCAKEDISSSIGGGEANVTFTVDLPELGTRAYGDGLTATKLKYYVYEKRSDSSLVELRDLCQTSGQTINGSTTVRLALIKGMNYVITFWAANDAAPYAFDGQNVDITYPVAANAESLDAFYGTKEFNPSVDTDTRVELRRPFAQLNAITTDCQKVKLSGITKILKSSIKVKRGQLNDTFNLLTGEATCTCDPSVAEQWVSFTTANIPAETNTIDDNTDMHLAMNYLLVNGEKSLIDVELSVIGEHNSADFPFTATTYTNIPVQRNYKTNIIGSLLTKATDFSVEILPGFDQPDQAPEELFLAAVLGGEVTLTEDVVLTQPLNVQSTMTLNLNGKTISTTVESPGRHSYAIYNNGNLTITGSGNIDARGIKNFGTMVVDGDLTITNVDTDGGAAIWNKGKLTINNGTFATNATAGNGSYGAALNTRSGGEAVVNGGNFYAYSQLTYAIVNEGTTTINNAVVQGKHGAVCGSESDPASATIINGGSFELLENPGVSDHCTYYVDAIYGGTFSLGNNTDCGAQVFYESNIAEGYKAVENGNKWYVFTEDAKVVTTKDEFNNALASGGEIVLFEDITLNKIDLTSQTQDVVINANGKTITTNSNYGVQVKAGKNITLKNAKVAITVEGNYITYAAGFKVENGDYQGNTILLEKCDIQMINGDWAYAVNMPASVKNLNLVIDNCKLKGAIALQCWGDNNTITATNSEFICNYTTSALYTSYCVALQGDGTNKAENNTLNINGCYFSYTGTDNFNSVIRAVADASNAGNNTINVVDCTYDNKVTPFN